MFHNLSDDHSLVIRPDHLIIITTIKGDPAYYFGDAHYICPIKQIPYWFYITDFGAQFSFRASKNSDGFDFMIKQSLWKSYLERNDSSVQMMTTLLKDITDHLLACRQMAYDTVMAEKVFNSMVDMERGLAT